MPFRNFVVVEVVVVNLWMRFVVFLLFRSILRGVREQLDLGNKTVLYFISVGVSFADSQR